MNQKVFYPLSNSQSTLFLSRKYSIQKSITNVPTSFIIHESLDMDVLDEATKEAIGRWDSFGIRLTKESGITKQYFDVRDVISLLRLDFSGKTREEMESTFKKLGSKKMGIYNEPMAKIYLIKTPEGYGGIFSVISHLIMDSWAISSFYKDLMSIYYHKMGQGDYPKDVVPYEEVLQKEVEYSQTPAYEKAKQFWENEFNQGEPIYTHVNGSEVLEKYRSKKGKENSRASNGFFLRSTAGHDLHWVKKDNVDYFTDFIKTNKFHSMQTLFQMALFTYLSKVNNYEKDVSTFHNIARRSTLQEKRTGGTRAQALCFRNIMDEDITFIEACRQLHRKQDEIYRHADLNTVEMITMQKTKENIKATEGYYSVSMSFQLIPMKLNEDKIIESRWYSNGAVATMLYINIMDGDGTGGLKCYYEYMSNYITAEKITDLHESMIRIMLKGCENPEITLKELFKVV